MSELVEGDVVIYQWYGGHHGWNGAMGIYCKVGSRHAIQWTSPPRGLEVGMRSTVSNIKSIVRLNNIDVGDLEDDL